MFWNCCSYLFLLYNGFKPIMQKAHSVENIWKWIRGEENTHDIYYEQYINETNADNNLNIVLIHGFGASTYHWRDNIPELSKRYNVYAFDLLGFGASDKPLVEYTVEMWRDQTVEFVKKIYLETGKPVVLVGNSIGGLISVHAAASDEIKPLVKSIVLLNAVAIFRGKDMPFIYSVFSWMLQKPLLGALYYFFKTNIRKTLLTLYPSCPERVDDALVASIEGPAMDPNAREVFCRMVQANMGKKQVYMNDLLNQLHIPLYVLVGKRDPWIQPTIYTDFLENYSLAFGKLVEAGHCPHDEIPVEINTLILSFLTLVENRTDISKEFL